MLSGKCNSRLRAYLQRVNNILVNENLPQKPASTRTFDFVKQGLLIVLCCWLGWLSATAQVPSNTLAPLQPTDSLQYLRTGEGWVINNPAQHPWCLRTAPAIKHPAIPRPDTNRTAPFAVGFLLLSLMAFLRQIFPRYMDSLTSFIRPGNRTVQQDRLPLQTDEKAMALFNILYYTGLGTVLYFTLNNYTVWGKTLSAPIFWAQVCGGLLLYYALRYLFMTWVAATFAQTETLERYRFMTRVVNQTVALFLLPCIIVLVMTRQSSLHPWIIGISLALIAIGYLIRTLKSRDWVIRLLHVDGLHFLLYLCAFEILPIVVFVKLVQGMA